MPVTVKEYTDIVRPRLHSVGRRLTRGVQQKWSHSLGVWQTKRHWFDSRPEDAVIKPSLYQLDWHFRSRAKRLSDIVDRYVELIEANPATYGPGKYNVSVLIDFERTVVTIIVT